MSHDKLVVDVVFEYALRQIIVWHVDPLWPTCLWFSVSSAVCASQIRRSARLYNLEELKKEAERIINKNIRRVVESASFYDLHLDELIEIISSDEVGDPDEVLFWRHAIQWIENDSTNRIKHLDKVMENVRFALMDSVTLVENIMNHPLMNSTESCRAMVLDAMKYQLLPTEQCHRQNLQTKPRYSRSSCIVYCMSGDKYFMCYLPAPHNRWYPLQAPDPCTPTVPGSLCYSILSVNGVVFALGAVRQVEETASSHLECLQRFSLKTNMWTRCSIPQHDQTSVPRWCLLPYCKLQSQNPLAALSAFDVS